jgi:SM-20-related protein
MMISKHRHVLGWAINGALYEHAIAERDSYADTSPGVNTVHYPNWRKSRVLYDQRFTDFKILLEQILLKKFPEIIAELGLPESVPGHVEMQMTSHNDGEHYKLHSDNNSAATRKRLLTYVYYFHKIPKSFTGGNLLIYGGRDYRDPGPVVETIVPENDMIVFFDSSLLHEVDDVSCPSKEFDDGRFTINGWIHPGKPKEANDERPDSTLPMAAGDPAMDCAEA